MARKTEKALLDVLQVEKSIVLKSGGLEPHFHFHIYPIKKDTSWQAIRDVFEKRVRYEASEEEKREFITSLKTRLL